MRLFEIAILLSLLPVVLSLFLPASRRPHWLRYLPMLGVVLIALERYRWQMVPAYALTGLFLLVSLWRSRRRPANPSVTPPSRWRSAFRIVGAVAVLLVFALSALLPALLPVFKLPEPSGSLGVGTTTFTLLDASRSEPFAAHPSDKRELLIQVWYPAQPAPGSVPERMWGHPREIGRRLTSSLHLPFFLFDHFNLVVTHSYPDAPLAGAQPKYPLLIFSHGYDQGIPAQNTPQMEELASHGYLVFSIGHSYESLALFHPDGRIVAVNQELMKKVATQLNESSSLVGKLIESKDPEERSKLLKEASDAAPLLNASAAIWVADTRFVLDELTKFNGRQEVEKVPRQFAGRMDLARVGIFGMSFGGTVATDVCLIDARCRAGINLDGIQYGRSAAPEVSLKTPFMFMNSEAGSLKNEPIFLRSQGDAYYVTVKGSTHFNYTDFSLISPLFRTLGLLGPINGQRMEKIMNAYILAFFDKYLAGGNSPLLKGPSPGYPEVEIQVRTGPSK